MKNKHIFVVPASKGLFCKNKRKLKITRITIGKFAFHLLYEKMVLITQNLKHK